MKKKPRRPEETTFDFQMVWQTVVSGLTIGAMAFGLWYWMVTLQGLDEAAARNLVLLFMVLLQNVHGFNCRSELVSALKVPLGRNVILVFGVLAAQGIHILSMYLPFMRKILGTEPVAFTQWLLLLALAMVVLLVMELILLFWPL